MRLRDPASDEGSRHFLRRDRYVRLPIVMLSDFGAFVNGVATPDPKGFCREPLGSACDMSCLLRFPNGTIITPVIEPPPTPHSTCSAEQTMTATAYRPLRDLPISRSD